MKRRPIETDRPLNRIIYKHYLTSALIPILAIEMVLLLLYFGVSYVLTQKSRQMLSDQAQQTLLEISKRESGQIAAQFEEVDRLLAMMRSNHEHFFASNSCVLPHGEPRFDTHPNGTYYKPVDNGGSSIYYSAATPLGPKERHKARCSEVIDPLMKSIVDDHPTITQAYLNTPDNFNRLYPFMPDAPGQYGPNLRMADYNFFYLADPQHNPQRHSIWTDAYLDPAGQGWMISDITPIYNGDTFEGVSGLDVTIDALVDNVLSIEIPWNGSAFLVNAQGTILAMPKEIERIFGLKELKTHVYRESVRETIEKPEDYNLLKTPNEALSRQMARIFGITSGIKTLVIDNTRYVLAQETIPQTHWKLMILFDESVMLAPIRELQEQANRIGFIVLSSMLFFYLLFFLYLLRKSQKVAIQISQPIKELSRLTTDLGSQPGRLLERSAGISEVDQLIGNFNALSSELDARTQDYIQAQLREKMKEKDMEIAYRSGLFESASSYLHNIGNALTMLEAKIRMLDNAVAALKKSELGFNKILDMMRQEGNTLQNREAIESFIVAFNKAMTVDITDEIQEIVQGIEKIQENAVVSISHQQDLFNASSHAKQNYVQRFNVHEMLTSLLEDYRLSFTFKGIHVHFDAEEDLEISTMKFQLQNGLSNLIKNAIEAIEQCGAEHQGRITVSAHHNDDGVIVIITDNGIGINPSDKANLFTSGFTTKPKGHGLGLHAFNNFLNANHGSITLHSDGPMQGATVTLIIGNIHAA